MGWFNKGRRLPGWVAIGISPRQIDVSHVHANGAGRPQVLACDSYKVEGSVIASLAHLRKSLRLEHARCITMLAPSEYQLLQIETPSVPEAELRAAATWRVKDLIDYPVDRASIEVLTIPGNAGGSAGRAGTMYAIAAPDDAVRARVKQFEDALLPLEVIDIPELAQRNVAALYESEGRALALVSFDGQGGLLTISFGGELLLARSLDITADQLEESNDERRLQLLERIGLELQRSLDHFDRQPSGMVVDKLLVTTVAERVGLPEYLTSNLSLPAEAFNLELALDIARVPALRNPQRQAQCLKLIGAALRNEARA